MLTTRQEEVVRLAKYRATDRDQFEAFVSDVVSGRRDITDAELRSIVDQGLAVARRVSKWKKDT